MRTREHTTIKQKEDGEKIQGHKVGGSELSAINNLYYVNLNAV